MDLKPKKGKWSRIDTHDSCVRQTYPRSRSDHCSDATSECTRADCYTWTDYPYTCGRRTSVRRSRRCTDARRRRAASEGCSRCRPWRWHTGTGPAGGSGTWGRSGSRLRCPRSRSGHRSATRTGCTWTSSRTGTQNWNKRCVISDRHPYGSGDHDLCRVCQLGLQK